MRVTSEGEAGVMKQVHLTTYLFLARALRDFGDGDHLRSADSRSIPSPEAARRTEKFNRMKEHD
jgi:hypothetical protein